MQRYLSLISFTDQGIRDVSNSLARAKRFCADVESAGGKVVHQYWALGEIDGCVIFEAPDDVTAARLLLKLGHSDFVRTRTQRVFDASEFETIVQSLA